MSRRRLGLRSGLACGDVISDTIEQLQKSLIETPGGEGAESKETGQGRLSMQRRHAAASPGCDDPPPGTGVISPLPPPPSLLLTQPCGISTQP